MGIPDGYNGPTGSYKTIVVITLLPEMPPNPSNPLQPLSGTYPSVCLLSWSRGGQECLEGVPECHNQEANCLRSILSFYRPQKAFKTPKI